MTKAILIPTTGDIRRVDIETLKDYQDAVGGYIETVFTASRSGIIWLNEEGKIYGLPVNHRASNIALIDDSDYIVGNVIVTGTIDRAGNETDIPTELAESLLAMNREANQ